jgi:uncharacterized phage-associated protein
MVNSQYKKITQALRYLVSKSDNERINVLSLMKLVWAADRYHVREYATVVTAYDYRALPNGPISSIAYDIAGESDFLSEDQRDYSKRYVARSGHDIVGISPVESDYLSESDIEALDFAWQKFGSIDRFRMVEITHEYPEWKKFEAYFKDGASSKKMDVEDFFNNPDDDPYFNEDSEKLRASKALFEENLNIHQLIKG